MGNRDRLACRGESASDNRVFYVSVKLPTDSGTDRDPKTGFENLTLKGVDLTKE